MNTQNISNQKNSEQGARYGSGYSYRTKHASGHSSEHRSQNNSANKTSVIISNILTEDGCIDNCPFNFKIKKDIVDAFRIYQDEALVEDLISPIGIKTSRITTIDAFMALKEDWRRLYENCDSATIFSSWEWMYTWWEVYQDQCKRQLYILCFYQYEKLVGIAPFQIDKHYPHSFVQGKTLRFIGQGDLKDDRVASQYLDLIVLPGYEALVIKAVSDFLSEHKKDWDFADMEYLLEDALIHQCFTGKSKKIGISRQKSESGVRFVIPELENLEDYLSGMGRRWRKMYAKKNRLLTRDGEVKIESTDTLEGFPEAFEQLSAMHCSRWKEKLDHCIFESSHFTTFHKKILERLLPEKKAFIKTLTLNNEKLATYYCLTDKGQIHYYQSGFYSTYANKYSPLFILVCKEIGQSIKNGQLFDFMYADSTNSYKQNQYNAKPVKMYRLRWTPNPIRMYIFRCVKVMKEKLTKLLRRA